VPEKKRRETSKVLLWTVVILSSVFSVTAMILAYMAGEFGVTVTVIGGLWSAAVPVAIGCYSDKAKAENEIKLQMLLNKPPELEELRARLVASEAANKKLKTERDKAKSEATQLKQRLTPLEEIIRQAQQPGEAG
jgi:uncharacterized protein (DUF3084 family)